ncbi:MAG TPA: FAD-dependent oxidoreductase, partial [Solirubrobacterales bacterium]|nr:FAD-dependent oxidoreductase [Solirubrobacterales bacterium]
PRAPFTGGSKTEVAVIGGGIVGAAATLALAKAGASVVLVEGRRIAEGVTGNSTAKVSALHETQYTAISSGVGLEAAAAYAALNLEGLAQVAALVFDHQIECSLETAPNYIYAEEESGAAKVEAEAEAARAAGLEVELTDETDLPFDVRAAARLGGQIAFDSAAFTRALVDAAEGAGARVHEASRVTAVKHGSPCLVSFDSGHELEADRVVLATHMPLLDRGLFFARLRPQASYAICAPATDAPSGMYLSLDPSTRSIRSAPAPDGRRLVIAGGEGHKVGQGEGADSYPKLADWLGDRFDAGPVEHRWSAHDLMSPDELPFIGPIAPFQSRIQVATGFSKWGLAAGVAAAGMLSRDLAGDPDAGREPFDPNRLNLRTQAPELLKENIDVGARFVSGRLRRRPSTDLEPGEGRIVAQGLRQIAECRNEAGELHRVSARCTHLGCIVRWNEGDSTWDCPCHGSRFGPDGSVLNGPAAAPLGPVD